jgi:hypothetical protein
MILKEAETKMQRILDKLNIPLTVAWTPNHSHSKHGQLELNSGTLFIFDESEDDAWQTFTHELLEFQLRDVLKHYRNIINGLIEILEKSCYVRKEELLESIPKIVNMIQEERKLTRSLAASR